LDNAIPHRDAVRLRIGAKEPLISHAVPADSIRHTLDWCGARLHWSDAEPVSLGRLGRGQEFAGRADVALVEAFTADEQRGRTSQAYVHSAVGDRMRYLEHEVDTRDGDDRLTVVQRDAVSGLVARVRITAPAGLGAYRFETTLLNDSQGAVTITAISSAVLGFAGSGDDLDGVTLHHARSDWLAENRWAAAELRTCLPRLDLPLHGQDGRGRFAVTSHGAWSTGENLPTGILVDDASGAALLWQIETSGAWHWELSESIAGAALSLLGPTDLEHQFAQRLEPGEEFAAVPVAIVVAGGGLDRVIAEVTRYRRWLRADHDEGLPVVYNDFMNTLMGEPTTEALEPLIAAAAEVGAEYFCIDAGWFAEPGTGDWWSSVGEWTEAPSRFRDGLGAVIDDIRRHGMKPGLWLEPEVIGVHTQLAVPLPDDAYFTRFGRRVREHDRYQLDLRHPAAIAHLDRTVDRLVADFGVEYFKLDYNINPGVGTEIAATAAGAGLLAHTRAFRAWMISVQERHPSVLLENCSSGAMRADYSLLSVSHLQSTSDQQDHRLYPPIAASAPASILPEQCGNWAYPSAGMSLEETAFTLVTGLAGRPYLSGFLDRLRPEQTALVKSSVEVFTRLRHELAARVPFWPLGLPGWDDDVICIGLQGESDVLLALWNRSDSPATVRLGKLGGLGGAAEEMFPATEALAGWAATFSGSELVVELPAGPTARFYRVAGR
jgi:alpha-galactosidase